VSRRAEVPGEAAPAAPDARAAAARERGPADRPRGPRIVWACVAAAVLAVTATLLAGSGGVAAPATAEQLVPPFVEAERLAAFDGQRAELFGYSVSLDGDTLAVGARNARINEGNQGAVYVYVRSGTTTPTWTFQAKLVVEGGAEVADDYFGTAVDLVGDTLLVGAPGVETNDGAVHEFQRSGTTWARTQTIAAPGGQGSNESFGSSLSLSGGSLAVGSPGYGSPGDSGAVYVFTRGGSGWSRQGPRLRLASPAGDDQFGVSVALDGDTLLAGAPGRGASNTGAAYVYTRSGGSWTQHQPLTAPDPVKGADRFGASVTLDGPDLVVGAPGRAGVGLDDKQVGAAYPYVLAGGLWVRSTTPALTPPAADEQDGNQFGAAVALDAGTLAVGAPRALSTHRGAVYTFQGGQGAWAARQTLVVSGASSEAHLGAAVTVSGTDVVAGLPEDDFPNYDTQGSVTIFAELAASNDAYVTNQNTTLTVNAAAGVLANDANPGGVTLTAQLVDGPAHGSVTLNGDGSFTYVPDTGFTGADSYSYRARQPDGVLSSLATVTITVRPLPVAVNDSYATDQGVALTVNAATGVLANDTSGTGAPLTAALASGPANGTLTALSPTGSFTYTPNPGFFGQDTFRYTASDGANTTAPATVMITVKEVLPPVQAPDAVNDSYSTNQNAPLTVAVATGVLANDLGTRPLTAGSAGDPPNGAVTLSGGGSLLYTPDAGFFGTDTFTYQASNSAGTDTATVTITVKQVSPPAVPPTAVDDSYSAPFGTPLTVTAVTGVLANDTGTSPLSASGASDPPGGAVALNADGSFTYTPDPGFSGTDTFTYTASNSTPTTDTATVTITVGAPPVVVAPNAVNDSYSTPFATALPVPVATGVLANDTGTRPLTAGAASDPPNGAVSLNADGSFTYTSDAGFAGTDSFSYGAANSAGSDTATVTITVQPAPNQPPTAGDDAFTTMQDTPLAITAADVLANDRDPDGDPLTFASPLPIANPEHGTVTITPGVAAVYTSDPGFSGTDTATYAITDGTDNSAPATVTVTVTPAAAPNPGGGGEIIVNPGRPGNVTLPDVDEVLVACRVRADITVHRSRRSVRRLVLARGSVRIRGRDRVTVKLKANRRALSPLRNATGRLPVSLRVICRTRKGEVVGRVERRFAVLRVQRIVTVPGSWVGDHAVLTATGQRFMRRLKRRLRPLNVLGLRCDGYTALAPGIHPVPRPLSRRRARVACRMLARRSLLTPPMIVPHGASAPLASNANEVGRRVNRRVVITIVSGRSRASRARLLRALAAAPHEPAPDPAPAPDRRPSTTSTPPGL
jgi:Bacterial Ig domain/FG-GAP repeat